MTTGWIKVVISIKGLKCSHSPEVTDWLTGGCVSDHWVSTVSYIYIYLEQLTVQAGSGIVLQRHCGWVTRGGRSRGQTPHSSGSLGPCVSYQSDHPLGGRAIGTVGLQRGHSHPDRCWLLCTKHPGLVPSLGPSGWRRVEEEWGHLLILRKLKLLTAHGGERWPQPIPPAASSLLFFFLFVLILIKSVQHWGAFLFIKNVNFSGELCLCRSAKHPEGGPCQQAQNKKVQQGKSSAL